MTSPFDPDAVAAPGSGLFGLSSTPEESLVHVIAAPFDATTSYGSGSAAGPEAILRASRQVDLHDPEWGNPWQAGIYYHADDGEIWGLNEEARPLAEEVRARAGSATQPETSRALDRVNALSEELNRVVYARVASVLDAGKRPILLGGDHSVSFGAIRAASERHPGIGLLHIDAHADLRPAYEGFTCSHASILYNLFSQLRGLGPILQVGLRDLGAREREMIDANADRLHAVLDSTWSRARLEGRDLAAFVRDSLASLPEQVWVTFDVDGLDPSLCPHTGTPVPGGLTWAEAMLWLEELGLSGRRVVGCDLVEVVPGPAQRGGDSWDATVGARLLYRLAGIVLSRT